MSEDEFEPFCFGQELFLHIYAFELIDRPTCKNLPGGPGSDVQTAHFRGGIF